MGRAQAGDVAAFEALYDRNVAFVWRLARSLCRDPAQAEDTVADTFVAAWRDRGTYRRETGSVRGWLLAIALDTAPPPSGAATPEVRGCSGHMPDDAAEVIALAVYGGLSHTEIAERLALPRQAVTGRMRLGLERLGTQDQAGG
jgi:RNA polymerase sigma-70 factor, ECF subfamily